LTRLGERKIQHELFYPLALKASVKESVVNDMEIHHSHRPDEKHGQNDLVITMKDVWYKDFHEQTMSKGDAIQGKWFFSVCFRPAMKKCPIARSRSALIGNRISFFKGKGLFTVASC